MVPTSWYVGLSAVLFVIGVLGVLVRRNPLVIFMSIEIMLNAANLAFVAFGEQHGSVDGQALVFFVLCVAAAEVAVVDDSSGLLLYGASPHEHEAPASTTKIATAIVTLEHAEDLDQPVRVTVKNLEVLKSDGERSLLVLSGAVPGPKNAIVMVRKA